MYMNDSHEELQLLVIKRFHYFRDHQQYCIQIF